MFLKTYSRIFRRRFYNTFNDLFAIFLNHTEWLQKTTVSVEFVFVIRISQLRPENIKTQISQKTPHPNRISATLHLNALVPLRQPALGIEFLE